MAGNNVHGSAAAAAAVAGAELGAAIVELVREGLTFVQVGERLGIAKSVAHRRFHQTLNKIGTGEVEEYRRAQLARFELERAVCMDVLATRHPVVSGGKVFKDLEDDGPALAAIDRLLAIDAAEAKLLGLNARTEVEVTGSLSYVITGGPAGWLGPVPDDVSELTAGPAGELEG